MHCTSFHKTHNCSAVYNAYLLHRILSKSDKNVENKGKVNLKSQVKFDIQRTKLATAQLKNTGIFCNKFQPNWPMNVGPRDRKSFTTLGNV
jgi:hypothetical protein